MKEKILLKIALISSLIGILLLLLISNSLETNEEVISSIDETDIGSSIRISGIVTDINKRGSIILIDIAQLEKMNIVIFNNNTLLNKGDYIEVIGNLDEYDGNTQLIADKIILK